MQNVPRSQRAGRKVCLDECVWLWVQAWLMRRCARLLVPGIAAKGHGVQTGPGIGEGAAGRGRGEQQGPPRTARSRAP